MWFLYYSGMYLFILGVRISSWWNPKSKLWLTGRSNWPDQLHLLRPKSDYRIWFHVASLGEFEQARPVIERIKDVRPGTEIVLTFFSPSGFEQKKNYPLASVFYLPADLPGNAKKWLDGIDPDFAVFVKYDLWPGYLKALASKDIPAILISANWIPGFGFSSWSNPLNQSLLKEFKMIFLQRGDHAETFKINGFHNTMIAGDTRIDRAIRLPEETDDRIPSILKEHDMFDLVAGSTWPSDENLIVEAIHRMNLTAIIAPHEISNPYVERLLKKIKVPSILFSQLESMTTETRVIIVDSIGKLNVLYSLGRIAYVGGGFGIGIHNILEPMAHSKPVIFGPHYEKFPEANDIISLQCGWSINNKMQLLALLDHLVEPGNVDTSGLQCRKYLEEHAGATEIVADYILKSIPYIA